MVLPGEYNLVHRYEIHLSFVILTREERLVGGMVNEVYRSQLIDMGSY